MLRMGVIRRSTSPHTSPVVIILKMDGSNRVCIDYRKLNKITVFDPEPMGSADEIFHKLSKDKYFSKIDPSKGYWQVPVAEADIQVPKDALWNDEFWSYTCERYQEASVWNAQRRQYS